MMSFFREKWYNREVKQVFKALAILVGGIFGGYLLLVLVFCLPLGRIHNNVLESASSFNGEYKILIDDKIATKTDDFTDALMLLIAENGEDRNPFTSAIYDYHIAHDDMPPNMLITDMDNPDNTSEQYSRYWHGYLLFLKPLLLLFNYGQILVLVSFVIIGLIVGVVVLLQKRRMGKYIIPYVVTVGLMFPVAISLSIQYLAVFAILNLAAIAMLLWPEKLLKRKNLFYVFMMVGMMTSYFDLLTYPLVTLGIPLTVWLLMINKKRMLGFLDNCKQLLTGVLGWGLGYFGMWVGKWAIGSIITGENLFGPAINEIGHRTSTQLVAEEVSRTFAIQEAFNTIFSSPVWQVFILGLVAGIVLLVMKKIRIDKKKLLNNSWLLIIALMPLVWYMVLSNHSAWHIFFTYRTMAVLIFSLGCYVVSGVEFNRDNNGKEKDG